jgi:hypothetical protein
MPGKAAAWTTGPRVVTTRGAVRSWMPTAGRSWMPSTTTALLSGSSSSSNNDIDDQDWDEDVNYEKEFPDKGDSDVSPDPSLSWNSPAAETPKLGIDIGAMLDPLTEADAAELKAAATEVINDAIAQGIDDIELMRKKMKLELEQTRIETAARSEKKTQQESKKLLGKIDALTDAFLSKTEGTRSSTKMAAAADKAMQGQGKGVDFGTWGDLGGAAVVTTMSGQSVLLGSVQAAKKSASSESSDNNDNDKLSFLIVADTQQDPVAKLLLPLLTERLESALPDGLLKLSVYKPTATLPLGGDDAACVVLFLSSLSDKSSVYNIMDRVLRKTIQPDGSVGRPPSQIIGISTIGTERTNKMPYTMQNMMGGGKLDKRRQMEEAIVATVKQRTVEPACDYTICKFGELKESCKDTFAMAPGDVVDGITQLETAATVLVEAIAFQPAARNATLSCVGSLPNTVDAAQELLDDAFLRLDGPELARFSLINGDNAQANYGPLVEYIREWAMMLEGGKGLTTPISAEVPRQQATMVPGVKESARVQLLFLPTATGKNYLSREEEKERNAKSESSASSSSAQQASPSRRRVTAKDGGIEIVAEVTAAGQLRVRAKRCNYADDVVIKELSEETILGSFRKCIDVWKNEHRQ